ITVRVAAFNQPFGHFFASAKLFNKHGVKPWFIDLQVGVSHQTVAVEPLDVDSFISGAIAPDVHAVVFHGPNRSEEHTSELQSRFALVCRLLLEKPDTSGRRDLA